MLGLRWKRRRGRHPEVELGLALADGRATIAAVRRAAGARPHIVAWESFAAASPAELEQGLREFARKQSLGGAKCRVVLSPADYDLKLVERPANVPAEELADATRWLIRDLVEIDVETAAIAVLTIPDQLGRARTPHMFVVATRGEIVSSLADAVARAGLDCSGFEVVETAMLALESAQPDPVASAAMVRVDAKSSALTLASEGRLFLARPLRVDSTQLDEAAERALTSEGAADDEALRALEPLLLDVQRCLDYYEAEFGRTPATRITLLPGSVDLSPVAPLLAESLRPLRVETWSLDRSFELDASPPTRELPRLALAAGAAGAGAGTLGDALIPNRSRRSEGGFGLLRVLQAAALAPVVIGLLAAHQTMRLYEQREALDSANTRVSALETELASLEAEAAATLGAAGSEVDSAALRDRRDERLALLRDLGTNGGETRASFSSLLHGLARQDLDGVWLERIEFSEAGDAVALVGRTLRAEDVPTFLRRLRDEPTFAGRGFRTFTLEQTQDPTPGLRFQVATRGPAGESQGGPP